MGAMCTWEYDTKRERERQEESAGKRWSKRERKEGRERKGGTEEVRGKTDEEK